MLKESKIIIDIPNIPTHSLVFISPQQDPYIYPGTRPACSFCFIGDSILPIKVEAGELCVCLNAGKKYNLSEYIFDKTGMKITERIAVLAVGSNACPARLADSDKFGNCSPIAIPVFRGWINDIAIVYIPRLASYGSIPSTIMGKPKTKTEIWLTLLTEEELKIIDKSEGRGKRYDLIEISKSSFHLYDGFCIKNLYAYYENVALRDIETNNPILLNCFKTNNTDLNKMSQNQVQQYVQDITSNLKSTREKNDTLTHNHSVFINMPVFAKKLNLNDKPLSVNYLAS
jgi:hypothetical protein